MVAEEAQFRGLEHVIFESDFLSPVVGIGDSTILFDVISEGILEAIREIACSHPSWRFLKVTRQANVDADSLAKWAG